MHKCLDVMLVLWMVAICSVFILTSIPPTNATPLVADAFDYPVGPPNGNGYYIQQAFEVFGQVYADEYHAGEDWQNNSGGLATSGNPVFAVANGRVVYGNAGANYPGGVVVIEHTLPDGSIWYSVYSHLGTVSVSSGDVTRGQQVGTILSWPNDPGNSHLHFEIRRFYIADPMNGPNADNSRHLNYPPGPGYWPSNPPLHSGERPSDRDWTNPSSFINTHRQIQPGTTSTDVFLLVDLSSSFANDLPVFKAQAPSIISILKASNPDIRFGLGKYEDYPIPPFGDSAYGDKAYERLVDLTDDTDLVLATINGLVTRDGGDDPESQLAALYQAATGEGQDLAGVGFFEASIPLGQQANFRAGAAKLFLLWTDAPFHIPGDPGNIPYPGPSFEETVAAINALGPSEVIINPLGDGGVAALRAPATATGAKVIGMSSGGGGTADLKAIAAATNALAPDGGVDCNNDGTIDVPAGEPLVCSIGAAGEGVVEAMMALIGAAAEPVVDQPVFVYPANGQTLGYEGAYLFQVEPIANAQGFLWSFFQDGVLVWENLRDEGTLSSNEYGIHPGTTAHSQFVPGSVEVWVRALIDGQLTDAAIITVYLEVVNMPRLSPRCQELLVGQNCGASATFSIDCISLRIPVGVTCQGECAESTADRLRAEGITVLGPLDGLPAGFPPACVGFRPDIGGTVEGAQCLVDFLGPPYHLEVMEECRVDGFPYNVYLE